MTRPEALKLAKAIADKNPEYKLASFHSGISVTDMRKENITYYDDRNSFGRYHVVVCIEPFVDGVRCHKRTREQIARNAEVDWRIVTPESHKGEQPVPAPAPTPVKTLTMSQVQVERCLEDGTLWVYYPRGWKSGTDALGAQHQDHTDTMSQVRSSVRGAIPCDCVDCLTPAQLATKQECADCGSTGHDTGSSTCPGPNEQDRLS